MIRSPTPSHTKNQIHWAADASRQVRSQLPNLKEGSTVDIPPEAGGAAARSGERPATSVTGVEISSMSLTEEV